MSGTSCYLVDLTVGKGDVSPEELYAVIKKRIERILIRTVRFITFLSSTENRTHYLNLSVPCTELPIALFWAVFFRFFSLISNVYLLSI